MINSIDLAVKKRSFIAILIALLFIVGSGFIAAPNVNAQLACPASWTNDPNTLADDPIKPAEESATGDQWYDFSNLSFSYNIQLDTPYSDTQDGAVSDSENRDKQATIDVKTNASTAIFSKIYANFHNILTPFVTVKDSAAFDRLSPELKQKWLENYCITGLSPMDGEFSLEIEAEKTYMRTVRTGTRYCYTPPLGTEICGDTCPAGQICDSSPVFGAEEVTDPPERLQDQDNVTVPYALSLRDIARKAAYNLKEQYCNVEADCLNDNYTCAPAFTYAPGYGYVVINPGDPAARDKTGICVFKPELLAVPDADRRLQNMCTAIDPAQSVGVLDSKICHYRPPLSYVTSNRPDYLRVNFTINNSEQNRNELPFDTDLFANRGQSTNPDCLGNSGNFEGCELDGYYRSAFINKLSLYSQEDKEIFQTMKFRIGIGSDAAVSYEVDSDPDMNYDALGLPDAWTFDYVERLGGIAMLSEEARFMNPSLLPAGNRVIAEHNSQIYMRGGQVFFDNQIISNRPLLDEAGNPVGTSAAVTDFETFVSAQESLRRAMESVITGGSKVEVFEALYNTLRNGLRSDTAKNVLAAYRLVLRVRLDVPQCPGPDDTTSEAECLNINANYTTQYNNRYRAYLDLYEPFREESQALSTVSSPTIDFQKLRGEHLVTFTRNDEVYYGISKLGSKISEMRRVPGSQNTFVQIPYRAFLNSRGEIILVTSDVVSNAYKVIHYRPGQAASQVFMGELGLTSLRHVASYLDEQDRLHIASYDDELLNNPQTIRYIRLNTAGGLGITYDTNVTGFEIRYIDPASFRSPNFFAYAWRPGLAVAAGRDNTVHIVASGTVDPDPFKTDLYYFHFDPDNDRFASSPKVVTDQANDKFRNFIPNIPESYTSRTMSPSAASLELVGPTEIPTVVWVNRIGFTSPARSSELWFQAMVATPTNVGRTWNVHPLSSATEFLRTEITHPFVSKIGEMGVSVNDRVSKKNVLTGWFDAYGYKRCVYVSDKYVELINGGSTVCGSTRDMRYIQPNGGTWRLVEPARLQ